MKFSQEFWPILSRMFKGDEAFEFKINHLSRIELTLLLSLLSLLLLFFAITWFSELLFADKFFILVDVRGLFVKGRKVSIASEKGQSRTNLSGQRCTVVTFASSLGRIKVVGKFFAAQLEDSLSPLANFRSCNLILSLNCTFSNFLTTRTHPPKKTIAPMIKTYVTTAAKQTHALNFSPLSLDLRQKRDYWFSAPRQQHRTKSKLSWSFDPS